MNRIVTFALLAAIGAVLSQDAFAGCGKNGYSFGGHRPYAYSPKFGVPKLAGKKYILIDPETGLSRTVFLGPGDIPPAGAIDPNSGAIADGQPLAAGAVPPSGPASQGQLSVPPVSGAPSIPSAPVGGTAPIGGGQVAGGSVRPFVAPPVNNGGSIPGGQVAGGGVQGGSVRQFATNPGNAGGGVQGGSVRQFVSNPGNAGGGVQGGSVRQFATNPGNAGGGVQGGSVRQFVSNPGNVNSGSIRPFAVGGNNNGNVQGGSVRQFNLGNSQNGGGISRRLGNIGGGGGNGGGNVRSFRLR